MTALPERAINMLMGEKPQDKKPQPPATDGAKSEAVTADKAGNKSSVPVKAQRSSATGTDMFVLSRVFPDPTSVFTRKSVTLNVAWSDCLFVLDTNVLLLPYRAGTESLKKIGEIYKLLIKGGRLFIPARVAQEFASNRAERLKEVHQQINVQQSSVQIPGALSLHFLADLPEYAAVSKANEELQKRAKAYRDALSALRSVVEEWVWNDPVSTLYSELFEKSVVVDGTPSPEEVSADLDYRWTHRIPPGYKDASKDDNGVGDLLIWHSILALGRSHRKHVVFISGEEKPDWCVVSNKSGLYPRFELVDEYGRASGGKSFFLLQFSDFLKRQGASEKVVEEIRKEEVTANAEQRRQGSFVSRVGGALFSTAVNAAAEYLLVALRGKATRKGRKNFDFIVDTTMGESFACDVRVVEHEINLKDSVRNMIDLHQSNNPPPGTTPLLVFVAESTKDLELLQQIVESASSEFANSPIIGSLEGQRFVPV